jgi:hypothetical protein
MRAIVHQLLSTDASLTPFIPTERWFQAGAILDVPRKPFAILRWLAPVGGAGRGTFAHQLQVAVYDDRGSYQDIDRILGGPHRSGGVYPLLAGIANLDGTDGRVTQADYLGDSGDQEDVDYKANLKYSSWQIIGRVTG